MSELGRICTATPGVVHPTEGHIALCSPDADCIDAVVHREDGPTVWSTRGGVTVDVWYAERAALAPQAGDGDGDGDGTEYDLATDLANRGLRACCGLPSAEHCP